MNHVLNVHLNVINIFIAAKWYVIILTPLDYLSILRFVTYPIVYYTNFTSNNIPQGFQM